MFKNSEILSQNVHTKNIQVITINMQLILSSKTDKKKEPLYAHNLEHL